MNEATSARVARILRERGFDAYVIDGGLKAWRRAGLPVEQVPEEDLELLPNFD
jgi:rhodanese-related sulfurtransferase